MLHETKENEATSEQERAAEQDKQKWAEQMILLLKEINKATNDAGGCLEKATSEHYRKRYRDLMLEAERECPPPEEPVEKKKGKTARSTARNLRERLRDFEEET